MKCEGFRIRNFTYLYIDVVSSLFSFRTTQSFAVNARKKSTHHTSRNISDSSILLKRYLYLSVSVYFHCVITNRV